MARRKGCKHGVNKRTGRCLKTKRSKKRATGKKRCPKGVVKSGPRKGRCKKRR